MIPPSLDHFYTPKKVVLIYESWREEPLGYRPFLKYPSIFPKIVHTRAIAWVYCQMRAKLELNIPAPSVHNSTSLVKILKELPRAKKRRRKSMMAERAEKAENSFIFLINFLTHIQFHKIIACIITERRPKNGIHILIIELSLPRASSVLFWIMHISHHLVIYLLDWQSVVCCILSKSLRILYIKRKIWMIFVS